MSSKAEILARIIQANVPSQPADRLSFATKPANIKEFIEAVEDYKAVVHSVTLDKVPKLLSKLTEEKRTIVPDDFPAEWRPNGAQEDHQLTHRELDGFEAAITLCAVGIEETGTIVLDAGPGQGRRALSLIPDHHLCIIHEKQVVASVNEAVERLSESVKQGRPLTWISGPSATSDIELVRVEGVHGPRKLEVIVIKT